MMILSSPDVDEDVMILQPLHKRKEKKPKSTSQGCSSTNLNSRFQKEVTSSSTCPEQSSSQNSNEDDSDFLYKGLSKKLSKRRIIGEGPGTSGLKNKKEASLSSDVSILYLTDPSSYVIELCFYLLLDLYIIYITLSISASDSSRFHEESEKQLSRT